MSNKTKVIAKLSARMNLSETDPFASTSDFVEVTEWAKEEGFDICIHTEIGTQTFSLTHCELQTIKKLIKTLKDFKQDEPE
jgi:hypothetical protein